ncbi:unnamed protein product, partial [Phaeothamnion confervicola]
WGLIEGAVTHIARTGAAWEVQRLEDEIVRVRSRRARVVRERREVAAERADVQRRWTELQQRELCRQGRATSEAAEGARSLRTRRELSARRLERLMSMQIVNDCFHIWHSGPFGTVNGFRVGRHSIHQVDWQEVNAGLGQAAILLALVHAKTGVPPSKYAVVPMGSYAKIVRPEDNRILYGLHTDDSFSLFPRR